MGAPFRLRKRNAWFNLASTVINEPFAPPHSEPHLEAYSDQLRRRRRFWKRAIWISLGGVILSPVLGLVGTVLAMTANRSEGDETIGIAEAVDASVHFTMIGLAVSLLSILALLMILIRYFTIPHEKSKG